MDRLADQIIRKSKPNKPDNPLEKSNLMSPHARSQSCFAVPLKTGVISDLFAKALTIGAVGARLQPLKPHMLRPLKSVTMF
jgi:hypothetical protein